MSDDPLVEITKLLREVQQEITSTKQELKEEISSVKEELKKELKEEISSVKEEFKKELKEEISSVKEGFKEEISMLEKRLELENKDIRLELKNLSRQIVQIDSNQYTKANKVVVGTPYVSTGSAVFEHEEKYVPRSLYW